eukprot:7056277-Prymnesium_polylepis.1
MRGKARAARFTDMIIDLSIHYHVQIQIRLYFVSTSRVGLGDRGTAHNGQCSTYIRSPGSHPAMSQTLTTDLGSCQWSRRFAAGVRIALPLGSSSNLSA